MTGFTFDKSQHLRSKQDFERVYSLKNKAADGVLLLFVAGNQLPVTRIGLSVSKKHGGAVIRNRLKRLLREAFRTSLARIPAGFDLIAIPLDRREAALTAYQESLVKLSRRLAGRLQPASNVNQAQP